MGEGGVPKAMQSGLRSRWGCRRNNASLLAWGRPARRGGDGQPTSQPSQPSQPSPSPSLADPFQIVLQPAWRREPGMPSDYKRRCTSNKHGHLAEHSTRRVWGGIELQNAPEKGRSKVKSKLKKTPLTVRSCVTSSCDRVSLAIQWADRRGRVYSRHFK